MRRRWRQRRRWCGKGDERYGLEAPDRVEAGQVEAVAASDCRVDHHVVQDETDDGLLAAEGQVGPSLTKQVGAAGVGVDAVGG